VFPSSHYVTPRETTLRAIEADQGRAARTMEWYYANNKLVEAQRLEQRTASTRKCMAELGFCKASRTTSRHLSGRQPGEPPPTPDRLSGKRRADVHRRSHVTVTQVGGMYKGDRSRKKTWIDYGFRLPSALEQSSLKFEEFEAMMRQTVFVSATPAKYEAEHSSQWSSSWCVRPGWSIRWSRCGGRHQVDDLMSEARKRIAVASACW